MDLCSAIVYCAPKNLTALSQWLASLSGVDTHHIDDNGKIIITAEDIEGTPETKHASEHINLIQAHPDVLSVMLVSQFSDIEQLS